MRVEKKATTANSHPAVVVRGRITGMYFAAELARHGIPVRIIDKSSGMDLHSSATSFRARTLEIPHGHGLALAIVAQVQSLNAPRFHLLRHSGWASEEFDPELKECVQAALDLHGQWLNDHVADDEGTLSSIDGR